MFKIEKPETINKTLRFPLKLVEKMKVIAKNQGISFNKLVIQCCEYALNNLDKE